MTFDAQKSFILMKSNLSMFSFVVSASGVISKIHCQIQGHENLPLFSSKSFTILAVIFRLLIHFELIFAYGVR